MGTTEALASQNWPNELLIIPSSLGATSYLAIKLSTICALVLRRVPDPIAR